MSDRSVRLSVKGITVTFGERRVLDRVSIEVHEGEVVALLGPSGSGKSTVLRVIAGLLEPDEGCVMLDGRDITRLAPHRRGIGMVFQDEQLFPHRTVAENVAFGLRMQRASRSVIHERVAEMLRLVHLEGFGHRAVVDLSGGEAKRVALARALAPAPRVLLLDEPLTGLDPDLHARLVADTRSILIDGETTALHVTHDLAEAEMLADRVVRLAEVQA